GTIDTIHTQGFRDTTDVTLDLLLQGDGMFIVQREEDDEPMYTRAGNFGLDTNGDIVNPDGYYLRDTNGNKINIPKNAESYSIGPDGKVTYVLEGEAIVCEVLVGCQLFIYIGDHVPSGVNIYIEP